MAVKIHNYFEHYRRGTQAFLALAHLLCAVLAGVCTYGAWLLLGLQPLPLIAVAALLLVVCNSIASILVFKVTAEPLKVLTQAIAHVSKDPVITPPPKLSAKRYETSGLRAMVQTVYELAANGPASHAETVTSTSTADHLLANMPCGILALKGAEVVYANPQAPATPGPDGTLHMNLLFDQQNSFQSWLADCTANKVRDTHLWPRVADKLPSQDGRRIFDVAAYYQKESTDGIDTIVATFDRTTMYGPDQEDMDFIALAAHELRGPITVIRGYLDVIGQEFGDLTPDQHVLLERLQVSSERLSSYVNNILNVSRYDRHQFNVHLYEDDVLEIFKTLVPDLALRAKTQNRRLRFDVPEDLPHIAADRSSLSEVIVNLVDNAIKYSLEGGEVVVAAAIKEDMVEVNVTDNGIGMPASVMGNLFNRFYRSHRSSNQVGGTGLGLYICKAIIKAHGGTIWVRSVEGQGSVFGFTVPQYATVADKLQSGDNQDIVQRTEGWIKNHAMYRR